MERELAWAEVQRRENAIKEMEADSQKIQETLDRIEKDFVNNSEQLIKYSNQQEKLKTDSKTAFEERIILERSIAADENTIKLAEQLLQEAKDIENTIRNSPNASQFKLIHPENLRNIIETNCEKLSKTKSHTEKNQAQTAKLEEFANKIISKIIDQRIKIALLEYRKGKTINELDRIKTAINSATTALEATIAKASESGARIAAVKTAAEIQDEIRITDGHLAALSGISEDIERQYESYSKLYLELKEKAQTVSENRQKALEEVSTRMDAWRNVMQNLLDRVNVEYQHIMGQTRATGEVRLSNTEDIETADLKF